MENNNVDKVSKALTPEQAEAWIFTLVIGFVICLGLIVYTLITHNLIINYPDASLFKQNQTWLGFIGILLYFSTFILFWIASSIVRYLPGKIYFVNTISVAGVTLLLISFIVLFASYDLKNELLNYIGFTCQATGISLTLTKEIVEYRLGNTMAKFCNFLGVILVFTGLMCFALSIDI